MSTTTVTRDLIEVSPADLIIGTNVRLDARLDAELVESIRARGVITPVLAYRNASGALVVIAGQRRTLASIEAERETIPVVVVPEPAEADRLADQVLENDARAALTEAERVAAYDQMALLGMTAAQIARATGGKRDRVTAALAVAKSETARDALTGEHPLTLEEAAILSEFDGDEDATARLLGRSRWESIEHIAQRLRDDRRRAALIAETVDALTENGTTAVNLATHPTARAVAALYDADRHALDVEEHVECPGHATGVRTGHVYLYCDPSTGEPAPDQDAAKSAVEDYYETVSEDTDEDDQRPPYVETWTEQIQAVPVCLDPEAHGHLLSPYRPGSAGQPVAPTDSEADAEARKAERRHVIQCNKAWESAETVRRSWLAKFVAGKTAPKGAAKALAALLLNHSHTLADHRRAEYVTDLLGPDVDTKIDQASDPRALRLTLLVALAACEAATTRNDWRNHHGATKTYLNLLAGWGYTLSEVERLAAGLPALDTGEDATD